MVVDSHGKWMERWRRQFQGLGIQWLRSLVTAHPHPYDEDALLSFAYAHGSMSELKDVWRIAACVHNGHYLALLLRARVRASARAEVRGKWAGYQLRKERCERCTHKRDCSPIRAD